MTLTVEWVSKHSLYKEPWKDLQEIPVIRVATLRGFMQDVREALLVGYLPTDPMLIAINNLLAQLPEGGV